jgi:hypothetical protein
LKATCNSWTDVKVNIKIMSWLSQLARSWCQALMWDLWSDFYYFLGSSGFFYVGCSPWRGQVCSLKLLLILASTAILVSESCGTYDHIFLSWVRDSLNLGAMSPYLYHPGTGQSSYTPMHWIMDWWSKSKVVVMLQLMVSWPVSLGVRHPPGAHDQIFVTVRQLQVCWCDGWLWQGDWSVVYSCCWALPSQSFLDWSPAGLMTIYYCLKFKTATTWRARSPYLYPPVRGRSTSTRRHWVWFCWSCFVANDQLTSVSWHQAASHVGPMTRFKLLSDICSFLHVGHPPWWETGL